LNTFHIFSQIHFFHLLFVEISLNVSIISEYKYFNWNKQTNKKWVNQWNILLIVFCVCVREWISFHLKMKKQIPNMWTVSNSICHHQSNTLSDVDWFHWVFWRILIVNRESLCEGEMNVHCSSQSISCLTMFLCWNIHSICCDENDLNHHWNQFVWV
jgi:hypothetical protein